MKARKSPKLATAQEPGLDISSLIDVSFLLLIYFLVATTLKPKEVDLGFRLPGEGVGEALLLPPIALSLESDGSVVVNPDGSAENLGAVDAGFRNLKLHQRLLDYKATADRAGQDARISLRAANEAASQDLVAVFNEINAVGIEDVALDGFTGF